VGLGQLVVEVSKSHSDTPHSVGLLWTSDRSVAQTSNSQHTTLTKEISILPAGLELAIPAGERPQTHTSDRPPGLRDRPPRLTPILNVRQRNYWRRSLWTKWEGPAPLKY